MLEPCSFSGALAVKSACVTAAYTSVAPCSRQMLAAFIRVPPDVTTLQEEITDVHSLLQYLEKEKYDVSKYGVVAKSFGGYKAVALQDPRLRCVGMLASGVRFGDQSFEEEVKRPYGQLSREEPLVLNNSVLASYHAPTLILHGGDSDDIVSTRHIWNVVDHLRKNAVVELRTIEGAGHNFNGPHDILRSEVAAELVPFFRQNLRL